MKILGPSISFYVANDFLPCIVKRPIKGLFAITRVRMWVTRIKHTLLATLDRS